MQSPDQPSLWTAPCRGQAPDGAEDEPKHDYVKQKLITTTIYEHELDKKDISFINEYLDDIKILKEETLTKYNSRNDTLRFHNKKLSILMYHALEFKMESLLKKIYVWVAISIYQMSICDLHDFETYRDPSLGPKPLDFSIPTNVILTKL